MTVWNYKLFENFKRAAYNLELEVEPGWEHYTIRFDNGYYAYLWTPLNKCADLREEGSPEMALHHLKNNQDDFHIEMDNFRHNAIKHFYKLKMNTVEEIEEAFKLAIDLSKIVTA